MTDKALYINDMIHRYANHTFSESTTGDIVTVTFKDGASVTIAEAKSMTNVIGYQIIRKSLLLSEHLNFLSTTTERDSLSGVGKGTQIYNITTGASEVWDGTNWSDNALL